MLTLKFAKASHIPHAVVVEPVITSHGYETALAGTEGIEDLCSRLAPHLPKK